MLRRHAAAAAAFADIGRHSFRWLLDMMPLPSAALMLITMRHYAA